MNIWEGLPIVIFGTGSTSKEVANIIEDINENNKVKIYNLIGYVDKDEKNIGKVYNNSKIVCSDNNFHMFTDKFFILGVIIPFGIVSVKTSIIKKILNIENIVFPNIIHPSVVINKSAVDIGYGNVIYPGAVLTKDIKIKNFNTINMNVTIGHDVSIGNFNTINPLVSISGKVNIGDKVTIGTGSNIVQGITISSNSFIGMGSVVIEDVKEAKEVSGNFAINHRKNLKEYMKKKL